MSVRLMWAPLPRDLCADKAVTDSQIQFGARTAKMESGRTKGTTLVAP
jgi:hypothetical protein